MNSEPPGAGHDEIGDARLIDVRRAAVFEQAVSQATAARLCAAGLRARYLRGGIEGWQAASRPLADKPAGATP